MGNFSNLDLNNENVKALEEIWIYNERLFSKAEELLKSWEESLSSLQDSEDENQILRQKYIEAMEQFYATKKELKSKNDLIELLK